MMFKPAKFSYVVRALTPLEKQNLFPNLGWEPRVIEDKKIPTGIVKVMQCSGESYSDDEPYSEGQLVLAELDNCLKLRDDDSELLVIGIEDILGTFEEDEDE